MRPDFVWDETEFIAALNVLPEVDEYETAYHYVVVRSGQKLALTIWKWEASIQFDLYQDDLEQAVFHMKLKECAGARIVKYSSGELSGE
jgi:hypothetical protein